MILRLVSFKLSGIDEEQYLRHAETVADRFNQWEGLTAKLWLRDARTGSYGGAYLFADQAAADASRDTDLFRGMQGNPAFTELAMQEYEVIDDLTAITSDGLAPHSAASRVAAGSDR